MLGCISLDTSRPPNFEKASRGQAPPAPRGSKGARPPGGGLGVVPETLNLTGGRVGKSTHRFLADQVVVLARVGVRSASKPPRGCLGRAWIEYNVAAYSA